MKLIFSIPAILLLIWTFPSKQYHSNTAAVVYVGTGRLGADCSGSGICSIHTGSGQAPPPPGYKATMGLDTQEKLFLEFQNVNLPAEVRQSQFSSEMFDMQANFPIPAAVLQAIQAKDTIYTLKVGQYPIQKTSKSTRITFE